MSDGLFYKSLSLISENKELAGGLTTMGEFKIDTCFYSLFPTISMFTFFNVLSNIGQH